MSLYIRRDETPALFHAIRGCDPKLTFPWKIHCNNNVRNHEHLHRQDKTRYNKFQNKIQQPQTLFQWQDTLTCRGSCKTHLGINRLQHKLQSQMAHQENKRLSRKHFPLQLLLIRETRHFIQLWRIQLWRISTHFISFHFISFTHFISYSTMTHFC